MAHSYRAVGWNRQKRVYDGLLAGGVLLYIAVFVAVGLAARPEITAETLIIRAAGTAAFLLLHLVLSIGPLCRIDSRFLPLLYNRRHLGVTMFFLASVHGLFGIVQFHLLGVQSPLVSLLAGVGFSDFAWIPFQPLGFAALAILFLLAATSHDFWLANLSPPVWKTLHMLGYVAYGLTVAHVALGALQVERHPLLTSMTALGFVWVLGLHLLAAARERGVDRLRNEPEDTEGFVDVGPASEIPEDRARIVTLGEERVAVFRYDGKISAISNVCRHQNGPLGEGRIVDGCVTCPWHGFQYRPDDGASPPPFAEKVPTFRVLVKDGSVWVDPRPLPAGTRVEPVRVSGVPEGAAYQPLGLGPESRDRPQVAADGDGFYIGYQAQAPRPISVFVRRAVLGLAALATIVAASLALAQQPLGNGVFEYLEARHYTGSLRLLPYPALEASDGATFLIVGRGKHGADNAAAEFDDRAVELQGALIEREGQAMIELVPESIAATGSPVPSEEPGVDLGEMTLVGEIVDSKCYLGVMKPGDGKTHRGCATLCIRGGIPPILVLRDETGRRRHLLLVDEAEQPINERILEWIARPVEVTGRLVRRSGLLVFAVDPDRVRPLG